ncbi:hypothetical protein COCOBI_19-0620 [Coccomyxa sp. Obi]|nr:hypothetical protein COCOBI_19-0620 [Coccomyxa sp. Obi]
MTFLFNPEPPLQAFFCLTGFFSALTLLPVLEATPSYTTTLMRYYKRRALRIIPSYYTVLLLVRMVLLEFLDTSQAPRYIQSVFFDPWSAIEEKRCREKIMYNVFFVSNHLPGPSCYGSVWSLAIQMQFWVAFPLVLVLLQPHRKGFRKRAAQTFAATIGAVLAYRAWQVQAIKLWTHMPLSLVAPPDPQHSGVVLFLSRHGYFNTFARLGPISWGALSALVVLEPACKRTLSRHSGKLQALWIFLAAFNFAGCFINMVGPHRDPSNPLANPVACAFAYICIQGVLSPLLPALTLVLTTTHQPGASALVAKVLSHHAFVWLADITYDIYLLHPLVFLGIWYALPPSVWFTPHQPLIFVLMACLVLGVCILVGWVHNRAWGRLLGSFTTRYQAKAAVPHFAGVQS